MYFCICKKFKFLSCFRDNYGSCNIPEFWNNQQFKPKHIIIISDYYNFWWTIKFVFWNVFKIWMYVWCIRNWFENIFIYFNFWKYLVYSQKMDKIDSNLRNVTRALHVPNATYVLKVWVCWKALKCFKTGHGPKLCICFKTGKCSKMK